VKLARGRGVAKLGGATIASLVLLGACSLTTSLDGLTGGAVDAAFAFDSGTGGDSGPFGAEAGPPPEGGTGTDGATDADASPLGPYCDSLVPKPSFCDDFERASASALGSWDSRALSGGGVVTLDPSTRTPTGRELHVSIPVFPAGSVSVASLDRTFVAAQIIKLSYALRIDAAPPQGAQQVMVVSVSPPASNGDFFHTYLFVAPDGVRLVEETFPAGSNAGGAFVQNTLAVPIVFGTWQRIDMTLVLTAPPRISLHVDGMVAFDGAADPFYRPGVAGVSAGIHYTDTPSGPLSARVDDLYVDLK
jgi:hypothetical protein